MSIDEILDLKRKYGDLTVDELVNRLMAKKQREIISEQDLKELERQASFPTAEDQIADLEEQIKLAKENVEDLELQLVKLKS